MAKDITLVIVKPKFADKAHSIFKKIDADCGDMGERIKTVQIDNTPRYLVTRHYDGNFGTPYYEALIQSWSHQTIVAAVYTGAGIEQRVMDITGLDTEPIKCAPGTIRREYGGDESRDKVKAEGRILIENVVHRSAPGRGKIECEIWQPYLQLNF